MNRGGTGQKIAFFAAIMSYVAASACGVAVAYFAGDLGSDHSVIASLGAAVVFFVGAGIVLHVIGRANLPDLRIRAQDDERPRG